MLGAGEPADPGHVRLPGSGRRASYGDLRAAVVAYGRGWSTVPGAPPVTLVVMAAAHGPWTGRAAGQRWGQLVGDVARKLRGIDVRGGLDAEVEWGPAARARAWVDGYLAATTRGLVDLGSCTCPPLARLPATWSLADLVAIASASGRGVVVPQIYATAGGNATEWAALARWAARHHRDPVRFAGVLTETAACRGPPVRPCAGIDLDPMTAWRQLSDRSGQQLRWASDIGYLSAPGPVRPGVLRPALLAAGALALVGAVTTLGLLAWRTRRQGGRRPRRRRRRRR